MRIEIARKKQGFLKKTGQTTSYTPSGRTSQDDGGREDGLTHVYAALTAGQYSGTTNITVNAKTDSHSNNCVLDTVTGLMWSSTISASVGPASNGLLYWDNTAGVGEDIFAYCDAANTAGLSGYNDWRIPNMVEMLSVLNLEAADGLPVSPFSWANTPLYTSTTLPSATTNAVVWVLSSAQTTSSAKTSVTRACVLVRG